MQRAASGKCGRPCVRGLGHRRKRIMMFPGLHMVPVRKKGEPREFPEFRNGSMDLKLTVSERSPASKCTRGCTAQFVRRISCVSGRWTTWFEMRENPPTRLGKLKARGFLQGDGGETGAGTHDPVDPRPPVVLGHRPPRRAEGHRLLRL